MLSLRCISGCISGLARARDEPLQGGVCRGASRPRSPHGGRRSAGRVVLRLDALGGDATEADGLVPAQRFGERRRCELTHCMPQRDELLSVAALALGRQVGRAGR